MKHKPDEGLDGLDREVVRLLVEALPHTHIPPLTEYQEHLAQVLLREEIWRHGRCDGPLEGARDEPC